MAGAAAALLFAPVSGVTTHQICRLLHLWWLGHLFLGRASKISKKFYFCTHNSIHSLCLHHICSHIGPWKTSSQVTTVLSSFPLPFPNSSLTYLYGSQFIRCPFQTLTLSYNIPYCHMSCPFDNHVVSTAYSSHLLNYDITFKRYIGRWAGSVQSYIHKTS